MLFRRLTGIGAIAIVLVLVGGQNVDARQRLRLKASLTTQQEFNSNMFADKHDKRSDVATVVTPIVGLSFEGDRGHFRIDGGLRSRNYWRYSELNADDRFGRLSFERRITPRLAVFGKGALDFLPNRDPVESGNRELSGKRPDYWRHSATGGFRYALDPISTFTLGGGYVGERYDGDTGTRRSDRFGQLASLGYERLLSERDQVGLTLGWSDNQFDAQARGVGDRNDRTLSATASWNRAWTQKWSTSFSGGLRSVHLEQDAPRGLIPIFPVSLDGSQTSLGYVGAMEVQRKTKLGELSAGYVRETRPSSGYGSTLDVDTVSIGVVRKVTKWLTLRGDGYWQRFSSVGDSVGCAPFVGNFCIPLESSNAIEAAVVAATTQLDWRTTERWTTFLRYSYMDQTSEGDRPLDEYTNHRFVLGFRYDYDVDLY